MSEIKSFYFIVEETRRETRDRYVRVDAHNADDAAEMLDQFIDQHGIDGLGDACMDVSGGDSEHTGTFAQKGKEEDRCYFVLRTEKNGDAQ